MHAYPRPQLLRPDWFSLDGEWEFSLDSESVCRSPAEIAWNLRIQVPFAPETPASGVKNSGLFRACWYRREFEAPALKLHERLLLHFGAVDYRADVWVNGRFVIHHEGGYTPFTADISDFLVEGPQTVIVRAEDDPADLSKPRGKQDWQRNSIRIPSGTTAPPASGRPSGWSACPKPTFASSAGPPIWSAGKSVSRWHWQGRPVKTCGLA